MSELRPDLDGVVLREPGDIRIWIVYHGRRHHIVSFETFQRLFHEPAEVIDFYGVEEIPEGDPVAENASLVRGESSGAVYLATAGSAGRVVKHLIAHYETFVDFGFNMDQLKVVPDLLMEALIEAEPIYSARDREQRGL